MAAKLQDREDIQVTKTSGKLLELRILVDGKEIADWSGRGWPMPATVLSKIEAAIATG